MSHIFFTDRDLGKRFPEILSDAGIEVERHADHFAPDCPDEVWLQAVARRGWIAVSHDRHIRYKPNELAAVKRHGVALLIVIGNAPYPELANAFVATLGKIETFLNRYEPPFIAKVYRPGQTELQKNPHASGTVSLWYPK